MFKLDDRQTRGRAVQCAAVALALVSVHCADPALGPRIPDVDDVVLNVNSTWTATILALPPKGVTSSSARDINDAGVVVGTVTLQGENGGHAVRWVNGVMNFLGEPKGTDPMTSVERINNAGVAVGNYIPGVGENHAVMWDAAGVPTVLPVLPGSSSDWAHDINDNGVIVGQSQHHAVRWIGGVIEDLHPPVYAKSSAKGITSGGDIVGWVEYATGERRAYLWRSAGPDQELGLLSGYPHNAATAVNDALTVVGNAFDYLNAQVAFRWTDALGMSNSNLGASKTYATAISNLDRLVGYRHFVLNGTSTTIALTRRGAEVDVLPNPLRWYAGAHGVNLCGDVVGTASTPSTSRAVLWTKSSCDP